MEILVKLQLWSYEIDQTFYLVSDEYDDAVKLFEEDVGDIASTALEIETGTREYFLELMNEEVLTPQAAYDPSQADEIWRVQIDIYYNQAFMGKEDGQDPMSYELGRTPTADAFVRSVEYIQNEDQPSDMKSSPE